MPPDIARAELYKNTLATTTKYLLPDGSVHDGAGLYERTGEGAVSGGIANINDCISYGEEEPDPEKVLFWHPPVK